MRSEFKQKNAFQQIFIVTQFLGWTKASLQQKIVYDTSTKNLKKVNLFD